MIIDFHTHIFPKEIRENREKFFPSESSFKLLYNSKGSKLVGPRDLINSMDEQHVDKSVIFGFPWKNPQTYIQQNDFIMETCVGSAPEVLPPAASFRLQCDVVEWICKNVPRWNPISYNGYNINWK